MSARELIAIITAFALVVLLALCAGRASAEEVYQQPDPPAWAPAPYVEKCDREMWVAIYQGALASRSTPAQAHARADAIARGCVGIKLPSKR